MDALGRVVLHHGHVLVGGRVEDIIRLEFAEDLPHLGLVGDGCHHGGGFDVREIMGHHQPDVVLRGFRLVDQHQFRRFVDGNLADHFTADGAGRAGNQDFPAFEHAAHGFHIYLYLLAGEEVLNAHFPQLRGDIFSFFPFIGLVRHINAYARSDDIVLQLFVIPENIVAFRGYQHGIDSFLLQDFGKMIVYLVNFLAHQAGIIQARIV